MAAKKFWDSEEIIGDIPKNDKGDRIQIRKVTKGTGKYIDIRTYYRDDSDQLQPGKGISIPDDLADEVALIIMRGAEQEDDSDIRD